MSQPTTSRRRTSVRAALVVAGLGAGLLGPVAVAQAATADDFARLRQCESSGNYAINTGNGYYGAYQFDLSTWRSVGGTGYPNEASPATQDALAERLQASRGWAPWPACSASLGLGSEPAAATASPVRETSSTASRSSARDLGYQGTLLTTRYVSEHRADVQALQAQLATRGYSLAVDGYYGPETRATVVSFQQDAGIAVDGIVGPQTWGAAF